MNIIIFSDAHFYNNPAKSTTLGDGSISWLTEQTKIIDSIFEYAKEVKAERIIFNGDLFEEKNRVNAYIFNTVWKKFASLGNATPLVLNMGNHDYLTYKRLSVIEPFSAFYELIREIMDYKIDPPDYYVRIVPHGMLNEETILPLEECADYKCTILFTHENIAGLTTGSKDITIKSNFTVKDFSRWTYVFNGHIHRPQTIDNVINVGSIMPQDWGEAGEQKRFIHFKDGEVKSIPIDHPKFYISDYSQLTDDAKEFILKDSRNYYRFDVDSTQVKDPIFKQWNVSYNITKKKAREVRMQSQLSIEDELQQYVNMTESQLDKTKLIEYAQKIIKGAAV